MNRERYSEQERRLFARAIKVRKLIAAGVLDPHEGLYCVVCPSERLLELEAATSAGRAAQTIYRDQWES